MDITRELREIYASFADNPEKQQEVIELAADFALSEKDIVVIAAPSKKVVKKVDGELFVLNPKTKGWISVDEEPEQARKALRLFNKILTVSLRKQLLEIGALKPGGTNPFWPEWEPSQKEDRDVVKERGYPPVPPMSWELWVNPDPDGHPVARWKSLNGLTQQRPHKRKIKERDTKKFSSMRKLMKAVPKVRKNYNSALNQRGFSEERVRAGIVLLMDSFGMRVGAERHLAKGTRGASTLLVTDIVSVGSSKVKIKYTGKAAKEHTEIISSKPFAILVKDLMAIERADLPEELSERLFLYQDSKGKFKRMMARRVSSYLKAQGLGTAKDFRTFRANQTMLDFLAKHPNPKDPEKIVKKAVEEVAKVIGNTPSVARSAYISPAIIDAYLSGLDMSPAEPPKSRGPKLKGKKKKGPKFKKKLAVAKVRLGSEIQHIPKDDISKEEDVFLKRLRHIENQLLQLGINPDKDYDDRA